MKMKKKIHRNGMKKTGKRIVALFLAMVLAFGNAGTVLATEESETENVAEEAEKTTEVPKEEIEKEEEIKEEETETESTEADKPENSEAKEVQQKEEKQEIAPTPEKLPKENRSVEAQSDVLTYGDFEYQIWSNEIVEIVKYLGNETKVTIPESIDGKKVTRIYESAFEKCDSLKEVIIPQGVTHIGSFAFHNCSNLEEVVIPEGVTNIRSHIFSYCSSLRKIIIPQEVTTIEAYAFFNCSSLEEIIMSKKVTQISDSAFRNCNSLKEITIPDGVTDIGSSAFEGRSSLTEITIPETVINIGEFAFQDCCGLIKIVLCEGIKSIERGVFESCDNLIEIVMPNSVTNIGDSLFLGCSSLEQVIISENVTSIESDTFRGCRSLTRIVIPEKVKNIGWYTFGGCSSLVEVILPDSLTAMDGLLFDGCSSLKEIMIPKGVTSIGDKVFANCENLESIVIPSNVTSMGNSVFDGCSNLKEVEILKGITSVGDCVFQYCNSLEKLVIPNSVTSIGENAFYECQNLKEVIIPNSVTSIGESTFWGCSSLNKIVIPNSVTSIGTDTFYDCYNLQEAVLSENIKVIEDGMFFGCDSLEKVNIPENVTGIGTSAFAWCGMEEITIPKGVEVIEKYAFSRCSSLTKVTIPEKINTIKRSTFRECSSLTDVIIPKSMASIEEEAFWGCGSLQYIILPESVEMIGQDAFGNIGNEFKIYGIPNSYAESYADTNSIPFKDVCDFNESEDHNVFGRVSSNTTDSVTINDKTYQLYKREEDWISWKLTENEYQNMYVLLSLNENEQILKIEEPVIKMGLFEEWNGTNNTAMIDGELYKLSEFADLSFLGRIESILGEQVKYMSFKNKNGMKYFYGLQGYKSVVGKLTAFDPLSSPAMAYIDGKGYSVSENDEVYESLAKYLFKNVVCTVLNDKVEEVYLAENLTSAGYVIKTNPSTLNYQNKKYDSESSEVSITVTNNVSSSFVGNVNDLKNVSDMDITVKGIMLSSENDNVFRFGNQYSSGKNSANLSETKTLHAGEAVTFTVPAKLVVNSKYISPIIHSSWNINADIQMNRNGKDYTEKKSKIISIENKDLQAEEEKKKEEENQKLRNEISDNAKKAAKKLNSDNQIVLDPKLTMDLLTKEQQEVVKNAWVYELAARYMNVADVVDDSVQTKLITQFFGSINPPNTVDEINAKIKLNFPTEKYGDLVFAFKLKGGSYGFSGRPPYSLYTQVDYEIIGGNVNKVPVSLRKGNAGGGTMVDFAAFVDSVEDLVKSEMKSGVWDANMKDGINKVSDFIFGKGLNAVVKASGQGSVSDVVYKVYTGSIQKYKVHCPTDVFIYNSKNELAGAVVNNEVTKDNADLDIQVNGDEKEITVLQNDYHFEFKSTGEGTMNLEVVEYLNTEQSVRSVEFKDVPLNVGKMYKSSFPGTYLQDKDEFELISNDNEIVQSDSDKDLYAETDIANMEIILSQSEFESDGTAKEPEVFIAGLVNGKDYYTEYLDNINEGTARVVVTGLGSYHNSKTVEYKIITAKGISGDINADNLIDIDDVQLLFTATSRRKELTEEQKKVADVNGDGVIDITDVQRLFQYASKRIDKL